MKKIRKKCGRKKIEPKFYNEELKQRFLNEYTNIGTHERYARTFDKTRQFEEEKQKDLYEFNSLEIEDMLTAFNAKTLDSLRSYRSIFKKYLNFCIKEKCLINGMLLIQNNFDNIPDKNLFNMLGKLPRKHRYFRSWKEYNEVLNLKHKYEYMNNQDIACFILLFNGIKAIDAPLIITRTIDFENKILQYKDKIIKFNDEEIKILKGAYLESYYTSVKFNKKTGEIVPFKQRAILADSKYLVRGIITDNENTQNNVPVTRGLISRRIKMICKFYLKNLSLDSESVYKSRQFLLMNDIEQKLDKELTVNDIKNIILEYNLSSTKKSKILENYKLWKMDMD